MEKIIVFLFSILLTFNISCTNNNAHNDSSIKLLNAKIDNWHKDAAQANLDAYLGFLSKDAIYIGTDCSERWTKAEFKKFCDPYFAKSKTWDFTPIERNIDVKGNIAWFDETLKTQMGICRASGVLIKENKQWKLRHYHLSVTINNDKLNEFLKIEQ